MVRIQLGIAIAAVAATLLAPVAAAEPDTSDYVRTQSGRVRCIVTSADTGHSGGPAVICETSGKGFAQAPPVDFGLRMHNAVVDGAGDFSWADGNIGAGEIENDIVLTYGRTYHLHGWTIAPDSSGTRFTNDATGHGMFVSVENVDPF